MVLAVGHRSSHNSPQCTRTFFNSYPSPACASIVQLTHLLPPDFYRVASFPSYRASETRLPRRDEDRVKKGRNLTSRMNWTHNRADRIDWWCVILRHGSGRGEGIQKIWGSLSLSLGLRRGAREVGMLWRACTCRQGPENRSAPTKQDLGGFRLCVRSLRWLREVVARVEEKQ